MIRDATSHDYPQMQSLLAEHHMVPAYFEAASRWWVAVGDGGTICGMIGVEYGAQAWLLRSALVTPQARGHGLGVALTSAVIAAARQNQQMAVYCFSTDAGDFWTKMDFTEVAVTELLQMLPDAPQVAQFAALDWLATEVAWRYTVQ
ncbi:MAG: GNAT family N-acetyltransferase [Chloroflexi bacterium]|nr:MAG: GNAT family N-acetyltransferase [Chloroflexota bacterium]